MKNWVEKSPLGVGEFLKDVDSIDAVASETWNPPALKKTRTARDRD